jgi:membrane protein
MMMWRILREAARNWSADNASHLSAAVAYYALFSVAPLAVLVLDVGTMAFGQAAARNQLASYLTEFLGVEGAQAVQEMIRHREPTVTWWSSLIATGVLIFTAANLFVQVRTGLTLIWRLPPHPKDGVVRGTLKTYLAALAMVAISGLFCLILLVGSLTLGVIIEIWGEQLPGGSLVWRVCDMGLIFVLLTALLTFTFRLLSDGRIPYRFLWRGAALSILLFTLGKLTFAWYLYFMGPKLASAYGAASSLIIFLIWVYYSAQILYLGAEIAKAEMSLKSANSTKSTPSASAAGAE